MSEEKSKKKTKRKNTITCTAPMPKELDLSISKYFEWLANGVKEKQKERNVSNNG